MNLTLTLTLNLALNPNPTVRMNVHMRRAGVSLGLSSCVLGMWLKQGLRIVAWLALGVIQCIVAWLSLGVIQSTAYAHAARTGMTQVI